jgi:hypothetical protein
MTTPRAIFIWIRDFSNRPTPRLCYGFVPGYFHERKLSEHKLTFDDFAAIGRSGQMSAVDILATRYPPPQQETQT